MNNMSIPAMVVALGALAVGVVSILNESPADDSALDEARLERIEASIERLTQQMQERERAQLEGRPDAPGPASEPVAPPPARTAANTPAPDAETPDTAEKRIARLAELAPKYWERKLSDEEQKEYWALVKDGKTLEAMLGGMEKKVEADPENIDARMELANGYILKLFTVPDGPEKGDWAMRAEKQWKEVLERDENHWDARFSIGMSYANYPDFLGKGPDAIREFEKVREVQERNAPEEKHVQTYLQLSRLYVKQGKRDKAKAALESAIARHPESTSLRKELEGLGE